MPTLLRMIFFELVAAGLLLLPGALLARRFRLLWSRLDPEERILPAFLLSAGIGGASYLAAAALRPTVGFLLVTWTGITAALLVWNVAGELRSRRRRAGGRRNAEPERLPAPGGRRSSWWALPIVLLGFGLMAYEGGTLAILHDSLEFVAFVQRMLLDGRIDLVSGAFRDVADLGPDPRRGVFHFLGVILCRLSGVSATEMWRWLPAVLVPLALWVFYAAFRRILRSAPIALAALLFFVAGTFFTGQDFINNLAYASRVGWVYSWVGLWALALSLDARGKAAGETDAEARSGEPRAAMLLVTAAGPILLGIHVLTAAQYLVSLSACAWSWAWVRSTERRDRRALVLAPVWALAATLPFLWLKVRHSFTDANPLFDHAQGLLYVAGEWAVLAPSYLSAWYGPLGLLAILLTIPWLWGMRRDRGRAFLVGSTWAALLVVLNPLAVRPIEAVGGHSVLFRVLLVVPWFQVLGWHAVRVLGPTRPPEERLRPPVRLVVGVLILGALVWHHEAAIRRRAVPRPQQTEWMEFPAVQRALAEITRREPRPVVVVSDPITSYLVPAFSPNYAVTPFGQHSSPADRRTVERIQDARAVLNPIVPSGETVRLLRKYQATYVLLNQTVRTPLSFYYAPIDPRVYAAQKEKFLGRPDLFSLIYDRQDVQVFRFADPGEDWRDTVASGNPYRALGAAEARGASRSDLAARLGVREWVGPKVGGIELIGTASDSLPACRRNGILTVESYWRRTDDPYVLPVAVFLRLQAEYPDRRFESPTFGRLFRAWYESRNQVSYRFGRDLEPLGAEYPGFLWEPGAVYRAALSVEIPPNLAPGRHSVGLLVRQTPFAPNIRLRDLFSLRDSNEGLQIGEVSIAP